MSLQPLTPTQNWYNYLSNSAPVLTAGTFIEEYQREFDRMYLGPAKSTIDYAGAKLNDVYTAAFVPIEYQLSTINTIVGSVGNTAGKVTEAAKNVSGTVTAAGVGFGAGFGAVLLITGLAAAAFIVYKVK